MTIDPRHTTWGIVKPRLEKELAEVMDALVTAAPSDVTRLQAQAQTLMQVRAWFEAGAPETKPMIGDDTSY